MRLGPCWGRLGWAGCCGVWASERPRLSKATPIIHFFAFMTFSFRLEKRTPQGCFEASPGE